MRSVWTRHVRSVGQLTCAAVLMVVGLGGIGVFAGMYVASESLTTIAQLALRPGFAIASSAIGLGMLAGLFARGRRRWSAVALGALLMVLWIPLGVLLQFASRPVLSIHDPGSMIIEPLIALSSAPLGLIVVPSLELFSLGLFAFGVLCAGLGLASWKEESAAAGHATMGSRGAGLEAPDVDHVSEVEESSL